MISVTVTDEALKDLFLCEGKEIRPAKVVKGIPYEATIVSSRITGPGVMEMVWDLHDGIEEITSAQITIESDVPSLQALHDAGII